MPIDREQFLSQFSKQALDERISLFLGAGGSEMRAIPIGLTFFTIRKRTRNTYERFN